MRSGLLGVAFVTLSAGLLAQGALTPRFKYRPFASRTTS